MIGTLQSQARARNIVCKAVKDGSLVRQPCEVCGDENVEAHHADYDRPLDVEWLCRLHHSWLHRYGQTVQQVRLLRDIKDPSLDEHHIVSSYAVAISSSRQVNWREVNLAISDRWSNAALERIKKSAWELREAVRT